MTVGTSEASLLCLSNKPTARFVQFFCCGFLGKHENSTEGIALGVEKEDAFRTHPTTDITRAPRGRGGYLTGFSLDQPLLLSYEAQNRV